MAAVASQVMGLQPSPSFAVSNAQSFAISFTTLSFISLTLISFITNTSVILYSLCFFNDTEKDALKFCGSKSGRDFDKIKETGLAAVYDEI